MRMIKTRRLGALLLLPAFIALSGTPGSVLATQTTGQARVQTDQAAAPAQASMQTGTIQALNQDSGTITISGVVLRYEESRTQVFLNQQRLTSDKLDTGMVVRYSTDAGVLVRIELLGPADKLNLLNQH